MKLPKLRPNDRVEIVWHDAHDCGESGRSWMQREDIVLNVSQYEIFSIGYFCKKENGFIYLVADHYQDNVSRATAIPIGCIVEIKKL